MYVTRVQAKGTITIPHEIREQFGLEPGTEIVIEPCDDGTFRCVPLPRSMSLDEAIARFSRPGTAPTEEEMERQVAEAIAQESW